MTLSGASKIVLIKYNLTSIPQYIMNCFQFLGYMCKGIDKINQNLFWNDKNKNDSHNYINSIPMVACDKICRLKYKGKLGIRKIENLDAAWLKIFYSTR